jgi:hypothetical protein
LVSKLDLEVVYYWKGKSSRQKEKYTKRLWDGKEQVSLRNQKEHNEPWRNIRLYIAVKGPHWMRLSSQIKDLRLYFENKEKCSKIIRRARNWFLLQFYRNVFKIEVSGLASSSS